jgi:hypothetical protein
MPDGEITMPKIKYVVVEPGGIKSKSGAVDSFTSSYPLTSFSVLEAARKYVKQNKKPGQTLLIARVVEGD